MEYEYIQVNDKLELRIAKFTAGSEVVLFIPGWVVDIKNYLPIIEEIRNAGYTVIYIEFREKMSSRFVDKIKVEDFHVDRSVEDLETIIGKLQLTKFHFLSLSSGSPIVMRYLGRQNNLKPSSTIFVTPAIEIKFNWWKKIVIRIPMRFTGLIVRIIELYMKKKFVNSKEPENAYKFSEKLYDVDIHKTQLNAIAIDRIGGLKFSTNIIDDKFLVVGAENDLLHPENEIMKIIEEFPNGSYLGLYSNKYTHSEIMGRVAVKYMRNENYTEIVNEIID